ncbi:MAG: molybdenum cofactor biosynthesis protein MoaE [Bacteroidales bacterium]
MERKYLVEGPVTAAIIASYISELGKLDDAGGHSIFIGEVRADTVDGKVVAGIEYSAYDEMVEAESKRIIKVTREAFSDIKEIVILHSVSLVRVGEISLFVLVTAGHRDQAIRGCQHVVEMIKLDYPVWKKEIFDDSSHRWKENP